MSSKYLVVVRIENNRRRPKEMGSDSLADRDIVRRERATLLDCSQKISRNPGLMGDNPRFLYHQEWPPQLQADVAMKNHVRPLHCSQQIENARTPKNLIGERLVP